MAATKAKKNASRPKAEASSPAATNTIEDAVKGSVFIKVNLGNPRSGRWPHPDGRSPSGYHSINVEPASGGDHLTARYLQLQHGLNEIPLQDWRKIKSKAKVKNLLSSGVYSEIPINSPEKDSFLEKLDQDNAASVLEETVNIEEIKSWQEDCEAEPYKRLCQNRIEELTLTETW